MATKVCSECKVDKDLALFYRHSLSPGGYQNKCKECHCRLTKANRLKKFEYYRDYERSREKDPKRVEARRIYQTDLSNKEILNRGKKKWRENNVDKRRAHHLVQTAVSNGSLIRQPCCVCGSVEKIEAHHDDYTKPLEVMWLCKLHHGQRHADLRRADQLFS